jgi:hypothetical protein
MENLSETIKLPSNWAIVTTDSIWKHLNTISKTGDTFNKEQLVKSGLYTSNEDNISRNLSYLKFLGFIEEERSKGKDQRFRVMDEKTVKDLFYELKASREENAKQKFKKHIQNHPLYATVRDAFFNGSTHKTLNDLEHFLRDGITGKAPQYYQKGGEFLMKLLSMATLVQLNGSEIILMDDLENNKKDELITKKEEIEDKEKKVEEKVDAGTKSSHYSVKITTPDINVEIKIKSMRHIALIESLISTIKVEFEETLKPETEI